MLFITVICRLSCNGFYIRVIENKVKESKKVYIKQTGRIRHIAKNSLLMIDSLFNNSLINGFSFCTYCFKEDIEKAKHLLTEKVVTLFREEEIKYLKIKTILDATDLTNMPVSESMSD